MHKIGIIQFPGSNTERETFMACMRVGMQPYEVLWNSSHDILSNMDGFIIVGGFSYEDRSRAAGRHAGTPCGARPAAGRSSPAHGSPADTARR